MGNLLELLCRVELFSKLESSWHSLSSEKKSSYRTHFGICGVSLRFSSHPQGGWKCKQLNHDRRPQPYIPRTSSPPSRPVANYNPYSIRDRDDPRNDTNVVDVPSSVFYTTENADAESHTGYLRIIPVNFENDVVECDDYKELLAVSVSSPADV